MHRLINTKKGLVRTFIVIVFGIIFLSYIGFDLRTKIAEFQIEHAESITYVKQAVFSSLIPQAEDTFDQIRQFAEENDITVETTIKLLQEYKDRLPSEDINSLLQELPENSSN